MSPASAVALQALPGAGMDGLRCTTPLPPDACTNLSALEAMNGVSALCGATSGHDAAIGHSTRAYAAQAAWEQPRRGADDDASGSSGSSPTRATIAPEDSLKCRVALPSAPGAELAPGQQASSSGGGAHDAEQQAQQARHAPSPNRSPISMLARQPSASAPSTPTGTQRASCKPHPAVIYNFPSFRDLPAVAAAPVPPATAGGDIVGSPLASCWGQQQARAHSPTRTDVWLDPPQGAASGSGSSAAHLRGGLTKKVSLLSRQFARMDSPSTSGRGAAGAAGSASASGSRSGSQLLRQAVRQAGSDAGTAAAAAGSGSGSGACASGGGGGGGPLHPGGLRPSTRSTAHSTQPPAQQQPQQQQQQQQQPHQQQQAAPLQQRPQQRQAQAPPQQQPQHQLRQQQQQQQQSQPAEMEPASSPGMLPPHQAPPEAGPPPSQLSGATPAAAAASPVASSAPPASVGASWLVGGVCGPGSLGRPSSLTGDQPEAFEVQLRQMQQQLLLQQLQEQQQRALQQQHATLQPLWQRLEQQLQLRAGAPPARAIAGAQQQLPAAWQRGRRQTPTSYPSYPTGATPRYVSAVSPPHWLSDDDALLVPPLTAAVAWGARAAAVGRVGGAARAAPALLTGWEAGVQVMETGAQQLERLVADVSVIGQVASREAGEQLGAAWRVLAAQTPLGAWPPARGAARFGCICGLLAAIGRWWQQVLAAVDEEPMSPQHAKAMRLRAHASLRPHASQPDRGGLRHFR